MWDNQEGVIRMSRRRRRGKSMRRRKRKMRGRKRMGRKGGDLFQFEWLCPLS